MILITLAAMCVFYSAAAAAWNSMGHRITARIAYHQLTPKAKSLIKHWLDAIDPGYPLKAQMLYASVRMDAIKHHDVHLFDHWHYVNIPFGDNKKNHQPSRYNIVWAIANSKTVLTSSRANAREKGLALAMLIHLVGDVHQPMHCVTHYSQRFPENDKGGLRHRVEHSKYNNLHYYWDTAAGMLEGSKKHELKLANRIESLAVGRKLCQHCRTKDFHRWARKSYRIAKNDAYALAYGAKPSLQYRRQTRRQTTYRLLLAGHRLGVLINQIAAETE